MKRILTVLCGAFLSILIIAVAVFAIRAFKGKGLDQQSKLYADSAIPAIISQWDEQALVGRASPELKVVLKKNGGLDNLFGRFHKLGRLKKYYGAVGESNISITTQNGKVITALYIAKADFQSGHAEIRIGLIKHGDNWQILNFYVNSPGFLIPGAVKAS